jgi:hypothetical protein
MLSQYPDLSFIGQRFDPAISARPLEDTPLESRVLCVGHEEVSVGIRYLKCEGGEF